MICFDMQARWRRKVSQLEKKIDYRGEAERERTVSVLKVAVKLKSLGKLDNGKSEENTLENAALPAGKAQPLPGSSLFNRKLCDDKCLDIID